MMSHQMEAFSALLALCAGNSPVNGELPSQRPATRSFDVFFHLCLKWVIKPWGLVIWDAIALFMTSSLCTSTDGPNKNHLRRGFISPQHVPKHKTSGDHFSHQSCVYQRRMNGTVPCMPIPGGCFTNVSRALQKILSKFVYCTNSTCDENFKLKLCTCAHSLALGTRTNFQIEILTKNVISGVVFFRENI